MADREKVVCGLECHMRATGPECGKCPYDAIDLRCIKSLRDDAIALLKAQEPVKPDVKIIGCGKRYHCGGCKVSIEPNHKFCRICGRAVKWGD